MNRSYRLVWCERTASFVAVSEHQLGRGKSSGGRTARRAAAVLALAAIGAQAQTAPPPAANALPQGGTVVSGQAALNQTGNRLDVNQASSKAILNWQSFNIGKDAHVNFNQPGRDAMALNRVTGADPSQIMGKLTANGSVMLVNANGVLFGKSAAVDVGGLVASTLNIKDADFLAGKLAFERGGSLASVVNQGAINVADEGALGLFAASVANDGIVTARLGTVALAAGDKVTLTLGSGAGGGRGATIEVDASQVQVFVGNSQMIAAESGDVLMSARAANALMRATVANTGTVTASSLVSEGGRVRLVSDDMLRQGGTVSADGTRGGTVEIMGSDVQLAGGSTISGTATGSTSARGTQGAGGTVNIEAQSSLMGSQVHIVDASGTQGGKVALDAGAAGKVMLSSTLKADGVAGDGGRVSVTGHLVGLLGAQVSADGSGAASQGGRIDIGGEWQGGGTLRHAGTTYVNGGSLLSARGAAAGGQVTVWSDAATHFEGKADASPTAAGGAGGRIEISSKTDLAFSGTVNAGKGGTVLFDPTNLIISDNFSWNFLGRLVEDVYNNSSGTDFGAALAIDGNTMVIGAPGWNSGAGAVYFFDGLSSGSLGSIVFRDYMVFVASGGVFAMPGAFGIDPVTGQTGTGPIATAYGQAYQRNAWTPGEGGYMPIAFYPINEGFDSNFNPVNPQTSARFGSAVALKNGVLAVGAPGIDDHHTANGNVTTTTDVGAVFMFDNVGGMNSDVKQRRVIVTDASTSLINDNSGWGFWEAGAKSAGGQFVPGGANYRFGAALAMDGDRLVIGAPGANGGIGQAHLFTGVANTTLHYPNAVIPSSPYSTPWGGIASTNGNNPDVLSGTFHYVDPNSSSPWDSLRYADLIWVGSALSANSTGAGSVGSTSISYGSSPLPGSGAAFGSAVALAGNVMAIGAPGTGGSANGAVWLYDGVGSNFSGSTAARTLSAASTVSGMTAPAAGSGFGAAIALAQDTTVGGLGGTLVIAAPDANKADMFSWTPLSGLSTLTHLHEVQDVSGASGARFGTALALNADGSMLVASHNGGKADMAAQLFNDLPLADRQLVQNRPKFANSQDNAAMDVVLDAFTDQVAPYALAPVTGSAAGSQVSAMTVFNRSAVRGSNALAAVAGGQGATFASASGSTSGVTAKSIAAALASGANVTLQASNDITLLSDILVGSTATPGMLTLQAGRNVTVGAKVSSNGGDVLLAAGDPGAVTGQTQAGTPTISFVGANRYHEITGQDFGNGTSVNSGAFATAGLIDLGGTAGNSLKGDVGLVAAGGWLQALVAPAQPLSGVATDNGGNLSYGARPASSSPFVNQGSWLVHVADKRVLATVNNTVAGAGTVDLNANTRAHTYTVTSALPGNDGNFFTWVNPVDTYDVGAQTGSSVTLSTYTSRWQGVGLNAFSFESRGANFSFVNPWFDMASNYALGYAEDGSGTKVDNNTGNALNATQLNNLANRRVDSGWSQEFQPTIFVRPAPVVGYYSGSTNIDFAAGSSAAGAQFSGFVDGDSFQPQGSVQFVGDTLEVTGTIRANDGKVRNNTGYSGSGQSSVVFTDIGGTHFDTTRTPTSQAAGGLHAVQGTGYDIALNANGTASLKAGMTYGSAKLANARTNSAYGKYVFVDLASSVNEYTQHAATLPALYTVTTKVYDVRDTMQVVWNTPAGGASGSGAIVGGVVDWSANASTPGATGTLAWNAGTQTYTYSHLASADVYTIAISGSTGVIDNMAHAGASGTRPVGVINQLSVNVAANGTVLPLGAWLGIGSGNLTNTDRLPVNSATIAGVAGQSHPGTNFRMEMAAGTINRAPLTFTASRPYDGTNTLSAADIKTFSGYHAAWQQVLDHNTNTSIGTNPTFQNVNNFTVPGALLTGSGTAPQAYATTGGPLSGITLGSLALGSYLNAAYYLDTSSASSTAAISPIAVTVSGNRVYDTSTTLSGLVASNATNGNGLWLRASSGTSAVNTLINAELTGGTLGLSGNATISSKNANANPSGGLLNGQSVYTLDLTSLGFTGPAAGSFYFNTTPTLHTATVRQAPLSVSGVTIAQKPFDNTTAATISSFGTISGLLTSASSVVDDVTLSSASATAVFNNVARGNNKPVTVTGYTVSGADVGNYAFEQPTGVTGNINPLTLTGSWSRVYNNSDAFTATNLATGTNSGGLVFSWTGVPNGATAPTLSGSFSTSTDDVHSATYSGATLSGLTLSDSSTYEIGSISAAITPKPLTLSFSVPTKVYDATTAVVGSPTVSNGSLNSNLGAGAGVLGSDAVQVSGSATYAFSSANAGTRTVNISGLSLTGAQAANYSLPSLSNTTAIITPKPLTVSGLSVPASKVYDGNTSAVVSGTASLIASVADGNTAVDGKPYASDIAGGLGLAGTSTGTYNNANVASASTVTFGGVSLASSGVAVTGNYTLSLYTQAATITPAVANFTARKQYDNALGFTTAQVFDGNGNALSTTGVTFTSATVGSTNASSWNGSAWSTQALNFNNLVLGSNYTAGSSSAVILPKLLTLSGSRTYDGTTAASAASLTLSGLVGSQTLGKSGSAVLASRHAGSQNSGLSVGTLALSNGTNGGLAANYTLEALGGQGYGSTGMALSNYTISAKAITLGGAPATGLVANKTYDGTTTAALASGGLTTFNSSLTTAGALVGSDSVSAITATFANKHAGAGRTANLSAATIADGNNGANYAITYGTTTADVAKANITVTANAVTKTYDGNTTATGTASLTSGTVFTGDSLGAASLAFSNKDVSRDGSNNVMSDKTVMLNSVTVNDGNSGNNYNVTRVDNTASTINPRALNITGTRQYDATSDFAGSALSAAGVGSEAFTLSGSVTGGVASANVQTNAALLNQGTLALGAASGGASLGNYLPLAQATSAVSISRRQLVVTGAKTYDGLYDIAGSSMTATGVNGESFALNGTANGLYDNSFNLWMNAGTYTSMMNFQWGNFSLGAASAGALASNYQNLNQSSVSYTITPRAVTITAPALTKTYDGGTAATTTNAILTALSGQLAPGSSDSVSAATLAFQDKNAGSGNKALDLSSVTILDMSGNAGNGNYVVTLAGNSTSTINPATLTVAGTRVYDATATVQGSALTVTGVAGETFSMTGSGTLASANVGNRAISGAGNLALGNSGNGGVASNYQPLTNLAGTVAITPAALTLSGSKVYDASSAVAGSQLLATGVNGETFSVMGTGTSGALATADVQNNSALTTLASLALGTSGNGGLSSNYAALSTSGSQFSVTPAALVIGGSKVYDGATNIGSLTALGVGGQSFSLTGSGVLGSANVQSNQALTSLGSLALGTANGGASSGNYQVLSAGSAQVSVTPKAVTLTAPAVTKTYDTGTGYTATSADLAALSTQLGVSGDDVSAATIAYTNANAGSGNRTVNLSGIAVNGGAAGNYTLTLAGNIASTITPANLLVTGTRVYDTTTGMAGSVLTAQGVGGESFALTGAGVLSVADVQTSQLLASLGTLTLGAASGGAISSNYNVISAANSSVSITPAQLSIAATRTYNGSATVLGGSLTVNGVGGQTFTMTGSGTLAAANVGSQAITSAGSLALGGSQNGGVASNYLPLTNLGGSVNITPAALTISGSKVYDASSALAGSALVASGVNGETFSITGSGASGNLSTADVQNNSTLANVTGLALGTSANGGLSTNYTALGTAGSQVSVTPAALVIGGSKTYDGTADIGSLVAQGVAGQSFNLTGIGMLASRNVQSSQALAALGSLALGSANGGAVSGNYQGLNTGSSAVSVTAKAVTLTAPVVSKVYDASTGYSLTSGDFAALTAQLGVSGDTVSAGTLAFGNANVGTANRTVSLSGLQLADGYGGNNYSVTLAGNSTSTITPAALVLTGTRTYDGSTAVAGADLMATGVAGQSFAVTGSGASGNLASRNVGSGTLQSVTGLTLGSGNSGQALASNYQALSAVNSAVTTTPKAVTLTAPVISKAYDGSTAYTTQSADLAALSAQLGVSGDTVSAATLAYGIANAGSGNRAVGLSGTTVADGNNGNNYAVTLAGNGNSTISPKVLTVTGLTAANKTYDGTTAVQVTDWGSVATGVGSETLTLATGATAAFTGANAANSVGVQATGYALADGSNGGLAANYALSSTTATTTATIAQAPLNVSAVNTGKAFSDVDPTLMAAFTGFVNGETSSALQSLSLSRAVGESAGSYTITPAATAQNYAITAVPGTFTISPADQLVLLLASTSAVYGNATAGFAVTSAKYYSSTGAALRTLTVTPGSGNSFTVDDGLGTTASFTLGATGAVLSGSGNVSVGNYAIGASGFQQAGGNFSSTNFTGGNYAVTPRSVAVSNATTVRREYDGTLNATAAGGTLNTLAGDAVTLNTANAQGTFVDRHAATGKSASFTGGQLAGADAGNYSFGGTFAATGTVDPRALTWTGIGIQSKDYDATTAATVTANGALGNVVAIDQGAGALTFTNVNAAFASADVLGASQAVNVTGTLGGTAASNYVLNPATASGTITPRAITVSSASVATKVYDATTQATLSGAVLGNTLAGQALTLNGGALFASANAGVQAASLTNAALALPAGSTALLSNYLLITPTGLQLSGVITPAALTLAGTRTYDGSSAVQGASLVATGVPGETFAVTGTGAAGNLASRNVGSNAALLNVNGLALGAAASGNALSSNYQPLSATGSQVTTTARAVTLTAADISKTYDATGSYTATANDLSALTAQLGVAGDTVAAANLAFTTVDAGAGNRTVTASGATVLDGNGGNNYAISYGTNTTSTIAKADLLLSGSRVYDGGTAVAGSTLTATGVAGQTFAVTGTGAAGNLASGNVGTGALASAAGLSIGIGTGNASNYNALGTANSSYTVTPAVLVLTGTRAYDGTTVVTGAQLVAIGVAGQNFAVAGNGAAGNLASRDVGSGPLLNLSGLSLGAGNGGALAGNYLPLTLNGASFSVTPKAVTLAAPVVSKTYDATTGYTLSAQQIAALTSQLGVAGDNVATATLAYGSADAGAGNRTAGLSGVTLADGNNGANYAVTLAGNAASTITPATLLIRGSRIYDGTAAAQGSTLTATGVAGQSFTLTGAGQLASPNVGSGALAGLGTLALGSGNGLGSNYLPLNAAGVSYAVNAKQVVLTAPVLVKTYDGSTAHATTPADLAALTAQLGVVGDTVSGATLAFSNANAGTRGVSLGNVVLADGNGGANYAVTLAGNANSTINPAALRLAGSRAYDGSAGAQGASLTAIGVNGESFALTGTGQLATRNVATGALAGVGSLQLGVGGGLGSNYLPLSTTGSSYAVTPLVLTVTAPSISKTYDATTDYSASTADLAALNAQLATGDTLQNVLLAYTDPNAGSGNRTITLGGTVADGNGGANYVLMLAGNNTSTILQAPLVLSGTAVYTGGTAVAGSNLLATGVAGQTFAVTGSGASGNLSSANVGSAQLRNVNGLALGGSGNGGLGSNYLPLTTNGATFALTPAQLTLVNSTLATKPFDGSVQALVASIGNLVGVLGSDQVGAAAVGAVYNDANPGANKPGTLVSPSLTGAQAGNYTLTTPVAATGEITSAATSNMLSQVAAAAAIVPAAVIAASSGGSAGATLGLPAVPAAATAAAATASAGTSTSGSTTAASAATPANLLASAQPGQTLVASGSVAAPAGDGLTAAGIASAAPTAAATTSAAPADATGTAPSEAAPGPADSTAAAPAPTAAAAVPSIVAMAALPPGTSALLVAAGVPTVSSVVVQSAVATGMPVAVAPPPAAPTAITATPGAEQALPSSAASAFVSVRLLEPVTLPASLPAVVSLPQDTFVHSAPQRGLRYEARMADGSPLPAWVRCDPANGDLALNPPTAGAPELLNLVIIARDDGGQSASTALQVNLKR